MKSIARKFAEFATGNCNYPQSVEHQADRAMLDTLGAIIAGGAHPSVKAIVENYSYHQGSAMLATGGTADTESAALINGTAAHVWDIDDTSYTGIMHGSAVILPALLAVAAEINADHQLLQRAFIIGSEITYCLADIATHDHYFRGWWSTTTFGLIGTTAAVSAILDLDEDQTVAAIGVAAAAAGGGKAVFGTDGKPFLVGDTARRAITIARMARAGLSGPEYAFEDERGFLKLLNNRLAKMSELETLGVRWRLIDPGLLFKTNPVCSAAHAAIDQMNVLMNELSASADQILRIDAEVPELVFISLIYPDPKSAQQAQFSLPFALACAALNDGVRFEDLKKDAIRTPEKLALMKKVHVKSMPDLSSNEMREKFPESARLTVTLQSGRTAKGFCGVAHGMPENPLSDTELVAKFVSATSFAGRNGLFQPKLGQNTVEIFQQIMMP